MKKSIICFILGFLVFQLCHGAEFTFDLNKNAVQCFFENIDDLYTISTLEYQVVSGGNLDVDCYVDDPKNNRLYLKRRVDYDRVKFNHTEIGEYKICFGNKFSTFKDKSVFMSFQVQRKNPLHEIFKESNTTMTLMEYLSDDIHNNLEHIINAQTHYRLQESYDRRFSTELNDRVLWLSLLLTFLVVAVSVTQVLTLRKFFSDPKPVPKIRLANNQQKPRYLIDS